MNLLTVEINALRGKSDNIKRKLLIDERNFKRQQEFLSKLEVKYQDICRSLNLGSDLSRIREEIEEGNKRNLSELQRFNKEVQRLRKSSKTDTPTFMLEDLIRLKTEPIVKKKRYGSVKEYREDKEDFPEALDLRNPAVSGFSGES